MKIPNALPLKSNSRWNNKMFKLIGNMIRVAKTECLFNKNIRPAKIQTIPIIGKMYPVANNAPKNAVPASLNVGEGMNWRNVLAPKKINANPNMI